MPHPRWIVCTLAVATAASIGCSAIGDQQIDPERLRALQREYPVLREERAPEPKPAPGATPSDIPDPIEEALAPAALRTVTGKATFYADSFEGRTTASGIPFRQNQLVAAHRSFPFGTVLRVTNVRNDRSVNVRIVDRGPYGSSHAKGTIVDLSRRAAERLDFIRDGRVPVRVEVLEWGEGLRG